MTAPEICTNCGAPARRVPRPGRVARLWAWFLHGDRHTGESYECDNGHGWTSSRLQSYGGHRRLPLRLRGLWHVVAFNRTVIPTPQSYAVMALIGTVVGVVAQLAAGLPWWLGPIVFVIGSFTVALLTAFRGPQRRETLARLRDQVDPRGALDRHRAEQRSLLSSVPFVVVGLAESPQVASLGGFGRRNHELTDIRVAYGEPRERTDPVMEVRTSIDDTPIGRAPYTAEDDLRHAAAGPVHLPGADPTQLSATIEWSPTAVLIDGIERSAQQASLAGSWRVVVDLSDRSVVVAGDHTPQPDELRLRSLAPAEVAELDVWSGG